MTPKTSQVVKQLTPVSLKLKCQLLKWYSFLYGLLLFSRNPDCVAVNYPYHQKTNPEIRMTNISSHKRRSPSTSTFIWESHFAVFLRTFGRSNHQIKNEAAPGPSLCYWNRHCRLQVHFWGLLPHCQQLPTVLLLWLRRSVYAIRVPPSLPLWHTGQQLQAGHQLRAINSFIVHPTNPSIYAFCDAAQTAILFKCPRNKQFSMSTFGCRYVCEAEGYFAGSTDDQVFQCTKTRLGEWVQTIYKNEMLCGSN